MALSDNNSPDTGDGDENQGPVIRDNRRIDPETGEARETRAEGSESGETGAEGTEGEEPEVVEAEIEDLPEVPDTPESVVSEAINADERVIELTNDIKRVQAEYANYRKRVERDRVAVREVATAQVIGELLPILDDIGRAREHDELAGGFKAVGEALETTSAKLGLEKYAEQGDEFDPNVHEALTLVPVPNISVQTVIEVFQPGYRIGERILRPARVVVGEPMGDAPEASEEAAEEPAESAGDDTSAENGEDKK
ncbi:nucleotide exchange factor GrpE [Nocardiopsis sp. MG754419]|uniref:nucleotide exchange factor GrpE n=1 Tax=Nocardiopsis sp. MG754419 TaxID=2259865 RepID=UPI001BAD6F75|nr:nucleotide exchange factor GrpE [Nocardiopsis sp. MG754419]MBR8741692.1 nucleotide exchange factor GrpE [Nocardiopsis sp. MG754419]